VAAAATDSHYSSTPGHVTAAAADLSITSSLHTGSMLRYTLCSLSDPGILDNVALAGWQCLSWRVAVFIETSRLLCRQKTKEKLGCVLYISL